MVLSEGAEPLTVHFALQFRHHSRDGFRGDKRHMMLANILIALSAAAGICHTLYKGTHADERSPNEHHSFAPPCISV